MPFMPNAFDTQFDPHLNPFFSAGISDSFFTKSFNAGEDLFGSGQNFVPLSGSFEQGNFIGAARGSERAISDCLNQLNFQSLQTGVSYTALPMNPGFGGKGYLFHPKTIIEKTWNVFNAVSLLIMPPVGIASIFAQNKLDHIGAFDLPYQIVPNWVCNPIKEKSITNQVPANKPIQVRFVELESEVPSSTTEVNSYEGPLIFAELPENEFKQSQIQDRNFLPEEYPSAHFYHKIQDLVLTASPYIYDIANQKNFTQQPIDHILQKLAEHKKTSIRAKELRSLIQNIDELYVSKEIYKPVLTCLGHIAIPLKSVESKDIKGKSYRKHAHKLNDKYSKQFIVPESNINNVLVQTQGLGDHDRPFKYSVKIFHKDATKGCNHCELTYEADKTQSSVKEALEEIEKDFSKLGLDPEAEWDKLGELELAGQLKEHQFFESIQDTQIQHAFRTILTSLKEYLNETDELNKDFTLNRLKKQPQILTQDELWQLFSEMAKKAHAYDYKFKEVKVCIGHNDPAGIAKSRRGIRRVSKELLDLVATNTTLRERFTFSYKDEHTDLYEINMIYSHQDDQKNCCRYMMAKETVAEKKSLDPEVKIVEEFLSTQDTERFKQLLELMNLAVNADHQMLLAHDFSTDQEQEAIEHLQDTEEAFKSVQKSFSAVKEEQNQKFDFAYHLKKSFWNVINLATSYAYPDRSLFTKEKIDDFWANSSTEVINGCGTPEELAKFKELLIDNPEMAQMANFEKNITPSKAFDLGRKKFDDCKVFSVNGIMTSEETARNYALETSDALGGYDVTYIYNASQSFIQDTAEAKRNLQSIATEASYILRDELIEYFNNSGPESIAYIDCHSQGAAITKNALLMLPAELRERISVLAIAPAAYINVPKLGDVQHYASEWDFVHLLDKKGKLAAGDTLIILEPDKKASIWDHARNSPTYTEVKEDWYTNVIKKHTTE